MNDRHILNRRMGIGLRAPHISELLESRPELGWVEVHSENWMSDEGPIAERMRDIRAAYPVSLHGVGMSLGSADGLDNLHLQKLARLVDRCQPILISEHLSWGRFAGEHSNDLLPLPYNEAAIQVLVTHIDEVQQCLGRRILVENVSTYCRFDSATMPEWDFVAAVVERADCGLLLDLNNVYVNACNHGFRPQDYISGLPLSRVEEVHLAGFEDDGGVLIDTHSRCVQAPVWDLYRHTLPSLPSNARTLIEWDSDLPPLATLLGQADKASAIHTELSHAVA